MRKAKGRSAVAETNRARVYLAVVMSSDESGLYCCAENAALAAMAGVSPGTLREHLKALEDAGWIRPYHPGWFMVGRRVILIRDHPAAAEAGLMLDALARGADSLWRDVPLDELSRPTALMLLDVSRPEYRGLARSDIVTFDRQQRVPAHEACT